MNFAAESPEPIKIPNPDPFAGAYTRLPAASGGGGFGSGGVERNAGEALIRHPDAYVDADEVKAPSPAPERAKRAAQATAHQRKVALINRLASEWSVNGARTIVDELGSDFLEPFLEYMNEALRLGDFRDLQPLKNPGGFFVRKAYRKFNIDAAGAWRSQPRKEGEDGPE